MGKKSKDLSGWEGRGRWPKRKESSEGPLMSPRNGEDRNPGILGDKEEKETTRTAKKKENGGETCDLDFSSRELTGEGICKDRQREFPAK